jgi:hypothetical protein
LLQPFRISSIALPKIRTAWFCSRFVIGESEVHSCPAGKNSNGPAP